MTSRTTLHDVTSRYSGVLIGYELHRIAAGEETALQQILKDGIVCCRIVNCIIPNKIPKVRICDDAPHVVFTAHVFVKTQF